MQYTAKTDKVETDETRAAVNVVVAGAGAGVTLGVAIGVGIGAVMAGPAGAAGGLMLGIYGGGVVGTMAGGVTASVLAIKHWLARRENPLMLQANSQERQQLLVGALDQKLEQHHDVVLCPVRPEPKRDYGDLYDGQGCYSGGFVLQ